MTGDASRSCLGLETCVGSAIRQIVVARVLLTATLPPALPGSRMLNGSLAPPVAAIILNPAVGWAVRCVTRDGTTGDCVSGGGESNGWFELPAMQVMSQCFTEDPIPPPERIQLLRTLPQSGHEAGDTQISPACQMLLAMRAADGQLYLTRMVGPPRQSGEQ